jgi:methyl-accepting chemotaxis protein
MTLKISTRLLLGFGTLIAMTLLMVILGVYAVATIDGQIERLVHGHVKDTMDTVDIRETVNEVARAVYNLEGADADSRSRDVARLQGSDKIINKSFETLKASLDAGDGAQALKKALEAYARYGEARAKVLALALQKQDADIAHAIRQDLRPSQNALFNALDGIVNYQTERMEQAAKQSARLAQTAKAALIVIGVLALACGLAFSMRIGRSITLPASAASRLTQAISDGDLTQPVSATTKDEMGMLLQALENMRLSLTQQARTIRQSAESVAIAASEIALGSADLSSKAENQASQLERTASSMEQITATVKQNTDHALRANTLAANASAVATRGGNEVRSVVGTMQGISEASRRITDIVGVIDSIAFQTNILALNAAVEAARAGEQGRGFAVVASEVRALAQRSAQAAKEVAGLIQSSKQQVDAGTTLVANAGKTMDEIVVAVDSVTDIIAAISRASNEQLAGIDQVNQAVSAMSAVTQQNAAVVEQSATAAGNLSAQAQELTATVARFKTGDEAHARPASSAAPVTPPVTRHTPAVPSPRKIQPGPVLPRSTASNDGQWKEF